jgi:hypothetical protein
MRADITDRLRALGREHLDGRISRETYRRLRAPLLDGSDPDTRQRSVENGSAPEVSEFEITTQPRSIRPSTAAHLPPGAARSLPTAHRARRIAVLSALAALLAILLSLLVWTAMKSPVPAPASSRVLQRRLRKPSADPVRELLRPLLSERHWSDAHMRAVTAALIRLGPARIAADRDTDWFAAVMDSVRERLRQQQALSSTPITPSKSPLAALARTLAIAVNPPVAPARPER